ncbi:MAG TPA: ATP-binding protein [Kofleriaceae bacterium]|nr:ATP-binding protein [Kofleriaceae bacterium]
MSTATDELLVGQARVLEQIVRGEPLPEVLAALCRLVEVEAKADVRAAILLVDADGKRLRVGAAPSLPDAYNAAVDGVAIAPDVGTCCAAAARCEVVVTPDIARCPAWQKLRHLPLAHGLVAAWSMPIVSAGGAVVGTFGTYFLERREPTAHERTLVEVLARTAALAIERARSDRAQREHGRRQQFLAELSAATQVLEDPDEVMADTARRLAEHLVVDRCAYAEVEAERVFVITGDHTRGVPSIVGRWDVAGFGPACERAMLVGEPFVVEDSEADERIGEAHRAAYRATVIRAVICVPLHKGGRFRAAMAVHQQTPRVWARDEIELVATVVARCWEALERSRVARDLRVSEARYRSIVEATPECVKVVAPDGTLLQINAAGLRMIGAETEAQALGASVYDVIAPEDRARFRAFTEEVCRGRNGRLAFDIIGRDGTRRSMETNAVALPAEGGGFLQLAVTRDVSERVAAERALAESRARLEYAVRLSGIGFWYCDLPLSELSWDERVKGHFFLPPDARVTIETFYERIHPDDRDRTRHAIDTAIAGHGHYDVVYRTVDPVSEACKWIRALGGAAYDPDGTPRRFDGVTVDITAQKVQEEQLRDQDRRKDEFLATLAHELRNPLAPISTGLELLRQQPAQVHRIAAMMDRQLGHLVRMVDDLLDISRITLGKVNLVKARVDLRAVLDSALETTRPLVEAGGHELSLRLPDGPLPLDGDPTRLSQMFSNLVNNAAKYTPRGGRIWIEAAIRGDTLEVRVSDTGLGIPEDMLPRVFDIFTQIGRTIERAQGGLGIGLTLVRRLAEMHGGEVLAASPGVGQGSTFTVRLPLAADRAAAAPPRRELPGGGAGLKILVVDDNVDAAEMLAMLLEAEGNQTRLAHTGSAALAVASELEPDLVFLDIGLPEMNGYEVATRLRADPRLRDCVLVALTGWGSEEDRRQAHAAGFDRHLVKPIDGTKLHDVLSAARG